MGDAGKNIGKEVTMAETKTHWKKVVSDPTYLGEGDFQPGQEIIATIKKVASSEKVQGADGKSENKAVVHFAEQTIKPMILNVARSKAIEKVCGSGYFEDWTGVKIQLYVQSGIKAFGEVVNAVRVRPFKPKEAAPVNLVCADCKGSIIAANGMTAERVSAYTTKKYSVPLCAQCATKRNEAVSAETKEAATDGAE
jgi:hypothetical protein